ncbi:ATP-dependent DNA helicase DinG [Paenibacillus beijingensis]|uniref:3'-5' exonuclease DinG n=1 Tax=Paenibacillus beijingensis TaxID=1126833 RepID=A0A0D5NQE9_9BACL|nr:ATP-dependent DNA helicase DinG [Paenibacillus beijingensis]AJY77133.1 ATP-dependent DNA helicase DinG [Paenibacillus beijingensis]
MNYAVLDLETTGTGADDDMIQVGLVLLDEEMNVVQTFNSFVRPSGPIPAFITQLTGIDDSMVQDAPETDEMLLSLIPLLDDAVLVAHNVSFDAGFLNRALDRCGYSSFTGRRLDTVEMLRMLYPTLSSYQLGSVSEHFGIRHDQHHRADSDAMATAILFSECVKKIRSLPLLTLQRFAGFMRDDDLAWFLQEELALREAVNPMDPDSHSYFRQFALKVGEWTEEKPPRDADEDSGALDGVSFEQYLSGVQDKFRSIFPDYEEREAQQTMFREVEDAFQQSRHLLIEAGTGTGKSLGYLIPSLYYGVKEEKKIIVSTHTINLQEQIRQRDLPLLQEVLPFPFKASVFKGRGNYLCLRKFESKIQTNDFVSPAEDRLTAAQMTVWLGETETGDQEELNFGNKGGDFWETVASDADSCLNRACPWFKRCFYHRAKQESNISDVVITNHSMLFTDIRADNRLLPTYEFLVIDEAHHLEEVAGKHLGLQLSYFSLVNFITRMAKDSRSGLLPQLRLRIAGESDDKVPAWTETIDTIVPVFGELKEMWDRLFEMLYQLAGSSPSAQSETGQAVYRLRAGQLPKGWEAIAAEEANLFAELNSAAKTLEKLFTEMKDRLDDSSLQGTLTDLSGAVKDAARLRDELRLFVRADKPETVYWIEASASYRSKSVHLFAVPADVSEQLRQYFFDVKKSVVMTSATLSVQKSFQYACEQLGLNVLDEKRLKTVQLPSPFQYRDQALVMIPRNFPVLKGATPDPAYLSALVDSLSEAARETGGRMLVLFTSYRMLKQVYDPLKDALAGSGINVLGQGIDSGNRSKLTRRFRQQPASVLLGTSSFWEGVDIPGDALICLAIVRLPFQPPNQPLQEAKAELLQEAKQNPFMKLSIPQAVIRFKQGFGRLIRTAKDKGIVLIYDTRVIETYYGKYFLYSLPGPKIEHMHVGQMVPRMREWLSEERKETQTGP